MPSVLAPISSLLVNGVHRFATCWQILRTDGVAIRVTDHNTILVVDGNTYSPVGALSPSAKEHKEGVSPNNSSAASYLGPAMAHEDLVAGLYRDAEGVEFVVDWQFPFLGKFKIQVFRIVETTYDNEVWQVLIEDPRTKLRKRVGRLFNIGCDHIYGDPDTCGIDLATVTQAGSVSSVTSARLRFSISTAAQPDEYFSDGTIEWLTGANAGIVSQVKTQLGSAIDLHIRTPFVIAPGDTFNITRGCKRTPEDCKAQNNFTRYGGFPHVVPADRAYSTPDAH